MDSIAIGWTKQSPGEIKFSTGKKHSQNHPTRKTVTIREREKQTLENKESHLSETIRSNKILLENRNYTPLATINTVSKFENNFVNEIQIIDDKRLCSVRAAIATFIIVLILIIAAGVSVGIVFAVIKSQNSSGTMSRNSNQDSLSTTAASSVTSSISIGSQTGVPCSGYTTINDPTRNIDHVGSYSGCDNGQLFNTSNGGSWIQFVGSGGTIIPLSSAGINHCGAFLSGWFNSTLPTAFSVITNGTVCFETYADECGFYVSVSVAYCSGNYYVYFLPPVLVCNARYCTV